jgi:hypothetical protein
MILGPRLSTLCVALLKVAAPVPGRTAPLWHGFLSCVTPLIGSCAAKRRIPLSPSLLVKMARVGKKMFGAIPFNALHESEGVVGFPIMVAVSRWSWHPGGSTVIN